MARKGHKATAIDPIETLEKWCASQLDTDDARRNARDNWEPGANTYMDVTERFGDTLQVTHCERFYLRDDDDNETNQYIVVCWDDNGNVTFGGL